MHFAVRIGATSRGNETFLAGCAVMVLHEMQNSNGQTTRETSVYFLPKTGGIPGPSFGLSYGQSIEPVCRCQGFCFLLLDRTTDAAARICYTDVPQASGWH